MPSECRWPTVRFGDIVRNVKIDVDVRTTDLERYVAGEHMVTDDLHIRRWGTIGDGYLGPAFHRRFVAGQVLYGSRRTYLRKVAVPHFDGVCANTTLVLETNGDVLLQDLLPFIMQTEAFTEYSVKNSKGSVNPYINWGDIASYEFPLPHLNEQRRIAEILWATDDLVYKLERCVEQLVAFRSLLFTHMLNNGMEGKPARTDGIWPLVNLENVMVSSPDCGYSAVRAGRETGHHVLLLSALRPTGYQTGHLKPVDLIPEVDAARLSKGDFLISRSNTLDLVGLVGVFDESRNDVSFPDTMLRLHLDEATVDKRFLEQVLLSTHGRRQIQRIAAGTSASMKKINRRELYKIPIPLPSLDVQRSIVNRLNQVSESLHKAERHLASCRELKNALLREFL